MGYHTKFPQIRKHHMNLNLEKLVKWFCKRITLNELYSVLNIILEIINGQRPDIKFRKKTEETPNYRKFYVDPLPPLVIAQKKKEVDHYKLLLTQFEQEHGKKLKPVRRQKGKSAPPNGCHCQHCGAPAKYLSYNNGKLKTQVRCKVCAEVSMINRIRPASEVKYCCPHCSNRLFKWKEKKNAIFYKCPNSKCSNYLKNKKKLTVQELKLYEEGKSNLFTLRYIHREYHFKPAELVPSRPDGEGCIDLHKAHHTPHTIGLVLTYSVSYGLSARMTESVMKNVHNIDISYQTVLNYMEAAASYAARFLEKFQAKVSVKTTAGDETYLKVKGKNRYTWFIIDTLTRAIIGFHLSEDRGTQSALIALRDAFGNDAKALDEGQQPIEFIADGNPSYDAALLEYQRQIEEPKLKPITRKTVVGLENLDEESKEYRQFKQLIERLNRTYKFHTRPRSGFKDMKGAIVLTTLFTVFYNYMRPHGGRDQNTPVKHSHFGRLDTYAEKWCKILELAG
jgi:putative transposase